MALLTEADLKLNITAEDKANSILKSVLDNLDAIKTASAALNGVNPFEGMTKGAADALAAVDALKTSMSTISGQVIANPFTSLVTDAKTAAQESSYAFYSAFSELSLPITGFAELSAKATNYAMDSVEAWESAFDTAKIPNILEPLYTTATEVVDSIGTMKQYIVEIQSSASKNPFADWVLPAGTQQELLALGEGVPAGGLPTTAKSGATSKGFWSVIDKMNSVVSELPQKLLYGGLNAMMYGQGIGALANAAGNFGYIQRISQLDNMAPNQAAQAYAMLGATGMQGSAGVDFLSNLSGSLQKAFSPVNGVLGQQAILLESLGITKADTVTSPWQLLNTIGTRYRSLNAQGRGTDASELLNLTGTSSVAGLLANWTALSKEMSSINIGMNSSQLNSAVGKDIGLQGNLQKLSIAFDELALSLVPEINSIVKAFTDLADGLSGKTGIATAISNVAHDLGTLGTSIVTAIAFIKGATLVKNTSSGVSSVWSWLFGGGSAAGAGALSGSSSIMSLIADPVMLPALLGMMTGGPNPINSKTPLLPTPSWWPALSKGLSEIGPHLEKWASGLYSEFSRGVSSFWTNLEKWASGLYPKFQSGVSTFATDLHKWASTLLPAFDKGVATMGTGITTWASGLMLDFTKGVGNFGTGIESWASNLWNSAKAGFDAFTSSLISWVQLLGLQAVASVGTMLHNTPLIGNGLSSYQTTAEEQFRAAFQGMYGANANHLTLTGQRNAAGHVFNIVINGGSPTERKGAMMLAEQIVNSLKLQGSFDLSF